MKRIILSFIVTCYLISNFVQVDDIPNDYIDLSLEELMNGDSWAVKGTLGEGRAFLLNLGVNF